MKPMRWVALLAITPVLFAQGPGDGCAAAADSFNRLKERFYADPESLNYKLEYSNLITATRICAGWPELWYFRAVVGEKGGASRRDIEYSRNKAKELGWRGTNISNGSASPTSLPAQLGTKWALLVGIGKFQDPHLKELSFPAADAQSVRDLLIDKKVGRFPSENVQLITNEEAKAARIREGIGWLRQNAKPNDLVLVYFASHGLPRDKDPNYVSYIAVNDSSLKTPATRYATSIQMIDLVNILTRELQALRVVLILDTCYSGDAASAGLSPINVSQLASLSESLRLFQTGAGRAVLTAASADQLSYESEKLKHGYFTYYLLKTLQDSSGKATIGDIFKNVKTATETAVRTELHKDQEPQMIAGNAAGSIVLGAEPAPSPASK